jgi:putative SOS response-associated peptidase YedK
MDVLHGVVRRNSYDLRLDPGMRDGAEASEWLKPYDARLMQCIPISMRINHVGNDDKECSAPVELGQTESRLFS